MLALLTSIWSKENENETGTNQYTKSIIDMLTGDKPKTKKKKALTAKNNYYIYIKLNDMEITNLVVTCKLSDGSVRAIVTDRKTEVEILKTIRSASLDGELIVSESPLLGIDIITPIGGNTLADYISSVR